MTTPREAHTLDAICELPEDNWTAEAHWLLLNEDFVAIVKQRMGEEPAAEIEMPRRDFDAMIDWYNGVKREAVSDE